MNKRTERFPMLRQFARGYLHEDLIPEYGNPLGAAKTYLSDLSAAERKDLAAESRDMMRTAQDWSVTELNRQLRRMGSAWSFVALAEFEQILRMFDRGR
jgi:hypothetical protein